MEWSSASTDDEGSSNFPESVPKIDHGRIFKAFSTPTLPKATARTSRTPAQDRLKRLQNALHENQKSGPGKHVAGITSPPNSVQERLKVTTASVAPPQATKRKAHEEGATEVPEKKRILTNSPPTIARRQKIQAKGVRIKRPIGRLPSTAVSSTSNSPASPPKKMKIQPKEIQASPSDGEYRVSVKCTEDNRLLINYEESGSSSAIQRKPLDDEVKDLSRTFYIVVDTNIFCHNLIFLDNILNMHFGSAGYAILVIPYIVIQELDNLKNNSSDMGLENNATRAIKFINGKLQARHPQVKGQREIAQTDVFLINPFIPDDSILNCCLQIKQTSTKVILLSNDINLRNKALVNAINALKPKDLREGVPIEFL